MEEMHKAGQPGAGPKLQVSGQLDARADRAGLVRVALSLPWGGPVAPRGLPALTGPGLLQTLQGKTRNKLSSPRMRRFLGYGALGV